MERIKIKSQNRKIKHNLMFVLLMFLTLGSCDEKKNISLVGDWYFFENDSIYNEVAITDTTIFLFSDTYSYYGPFDYEILNDTIYYFNIVERKKKYLDYKPRITMVDDNLFFLEHNNRAVAYKRITKVGSYFLRNTSNEKHLLFLNEYYNRRNVHLLENGFSVDTLRNKTMIIEEGEELVPID